MSKVLYTLRVIVAHPPLSLAADQYEEMLEEINYQITSRTRDELYDHILDEANKMGVKIIEIHLEKKQETR